MSRRKSDPRNRGRSSLGWGMAVFAAVMIGQAAGLDTRPELYDIEYAARHALLRNRIAESPNRPLLFVVGSSRTVMGFVPEQLPPLHDGAGAEVMPFNFGHFGAGPIMNLMEVSRMLADGFRPRWVFVELMPIFVSHEGMAFISLHTASRDLWVLNGYMKWYRLYADYALRRLKLAPQYTGELLWRVAPDLYPDPWSHTATLLPLGGCTFLKDDISSADRERLTETTRKQAYEFLQKFDISPYGDRATRTLLGRLRAEGIGTGLVLMPEGSLLKSWYPPGAVERFNRYCAALSREYGAPIMDARNWLADDELRDEHHVLKGGAAKFTRRFGQEVLGPYLATGDTAWAARLDGPGIPVTAAYNGLGPGSPRFPVPEVPCSPGLPFSPSPPTPSRVLRPSIGSDRKLSISTTSAN